MAKNNSFLAKPVNSFYILCISSIVLSILGLVMVFSASSIHSIETKGSSLAIVARQALFLLLSIPAAIFMARVPVFGLKKIARIGLVISGALLLSLRIPPPQLRSRPPCIFFSIFLETAVNQHCHFKL
jgi:cell division protein FtsW